MQSYLCACVCAHLAAFSHDLHTISDERGIVMCYCIPGHTGTRCQICARGYYMVRNICKPCWCNMNENPKADRICTSKGK